jgi:hypothetical protein
MHVDNGYIIMYPMSTSVDEMSIRRVAIDLRSSDKALISPTSRRAL